MNQPTREDYGVLTATAKTTRVLDVLRSLPMNLPEPRLYIGGVGTASEIRWQYVDELAARRIVAFLGAGSDWNVCTYDENPHTIATRYLDRTFDESDICVVVCVADVNLPDLAADLMAVAS